MQPKTLIENPKVVKSKLTMEAKQNIQTQSRNAKVMIQRLTQNSTAQETHVTKGTLDNMNFTNKNIGSLK